MEFDVDVELHATVRVKADNEADALDRAEGVLMARLDELTVHSVYPCGANEVA